MSSASEELFAFVLMPFDDKFKDLYVYGIKGTAKKLGINAQRLDDQIYREGMLERIYRQIDAADIVVADMSGKNPNVFYEVGYAHARNKLCILLTSSADDIPFDLKHHRHIVHNGSAATLAEHLEVDLVWARSELEKIRDSRIQIKINQPDGLVVLDKFSAKAIVDFKIDLRNEASLPSPEIEAVYFFTSPRWSIKQNGQTCPNQDSDRQGFGRQHFLTSPLKRLQKGAWARLEFQATRYMAFAKQGEELQSEYHLAGRCGLRLVTTEGNFDYEENVDFNISDIPF